MPAVLLLIRSAIFRLLGSRLTSAAARFLSRSISTAAAHLSAALRLVWERLSSQESKEAILGCVLCILNMHKKRAEECEKKVDQRQEEQLFWNEIIVCPCRLNPLTCGHNVKA